MITRKDSIAAFGIDLANVMVHKEVHVSGSFHEGYTWLHTGHLAVRDIHRNTLHHVHVQSRNTWMMAILSLNKIDQIDKLPHHKSLFLYLLGATDINTLVPVADHILRSMQL